MRVRCQPPLFVKIQTAVGMVGEGTSGEAGGGVILTRVCAGKQEVVRWSGGGTWGLVSRLGVDVKATLLGLLEVIEVMVELKVWIFSVQPSKMDTRERLSSGYVTGDEDAVGRDGEKRTAAEPLQRRCRW